MILKNSSTWSYDKSLLSGEAVVYQTRKALWLTNFYDFVKVAFGTAKVPNGKEQDYVDKLWASCNYVPQMALVAKESGKIFGHIMMTKTCVSPVRGRFEVCCWLPLLRSGAS